MEDQRSINTILPHEFDWLVEYLTGRKLLQIERDGIFSAIVQTLLMTKIKEMQNETVVGSDHRLELKVSDGFSTQFFDQFDVVEGIEDASGLPGYLCKLALEMVETRLLGELIVADDNRATFRDLGTVSLSHRPEYYESVFDKKISSVMNSFGKLSADISSYKEGKHAEYVMNALKLWAIDAWKKNIEFNIRNFVRNRKSPRDAIILQDQITSPSEDIAIKDQVNADSGKNIFNIRLAPRFLMHRDDIEIMDVDSLDED